MNGSTMRSLPMSGIPMSGMRLKFACWLGLTLLSMASAWLGAGGACAQGLTTLPGRVERSRNGELPAVAELQSRLDALAQPASGFTDCESVYQMHKAQAWLNFAQYARQNAAPREVDAAALENARTLVDAVEHHAPASLQPVELPASHHLRDDLWRAIAAVKANGKRCSAPKMTAYCEVQLAWVGYEAANGGWRHVDPYLRIAEDYCAAATSAASLAASPVARTADPIVVPAEVPPIEVVPLLAPMSIDVLFPHNRAGRSDILEPGKALLALLAEYLDASSETVLITVVGHADVSGSARHNIALSTRRAENVARELRRQGVPRSRIRVSAVGSAEPLVACARARVSRSRYWACLEPNRRVVVRVMAP